MYIWDEFLAMTSRASNAGMIPEAATWFNRTYAHFNFERDMSRGPRQRGYQSSLGRQSSTALRSIKPYKQFSDPGEVLEPDESTSELLEKNFAEKKV